MLNRLRMRSLSSRYCGYPTSGLRTKNGKGSFITSSFEVDRKDRLAIEQREVTTDSIPDDMLSAAVDIVECQTELRESGVTGRSAFFN